MDELPKEEKGEERDDRENRNTEVLGGGSRWSPNSCTGRLA